MFHVLGMDSCPFCTKLTGAMALYFGTQDLDKHVCYHDANNRHDLERFLQEVGSVVPSSFKTVPVVVQEFSDGSLKFIGGFDKFIKTFHCHKKK